MSKDKRLFIGLDLETSGTTHEHHVPIQLGLAMPNGILFSRLIGGWNFYDEADPMQTDLSHETMPWWSSSAFDVHGITKERLQFADPAVFVDKDAAKFIGEASGKTWIGNRIMVGWNVACMTPDSRVLTSDFKWTAMGELEPGQGLAAWLEPESSPTGRRRWQEASVLSNRFDTAEVFAVEFEDGQVLHTTAEHPWLVPAFNNAQGYKWRRTANLTDQRSSAVTQLLPVTNQDTSWEAGWLAGLLDGDGSINYHKRITITLAQNEGAVLQKARQILEQRGYKTSDYIKPSQPRTNTPNHTLTILGGKYTALKLLQEIRPVRILEKVGVHSLGALKPGTATGDRPTPKKVVNVQSIGQQDITRLSTSTGTYIAEGYAMHNSFDGPYVRRYLPLVSQSLSYRSVDLNAVVFTISEALGPSYGTLKRASKEYAQHKLGGEEGANWHDAGYDAAAALYSFEYLQSVIRRGDLL